MLRPLGAWSRAAWTEDRLQALIAEEFGQEQVIVLANREPFRHERAQSGSVVVTHSTSGLVTAVEPLACACSAVWIAHGSGDADRGAVDSRDGLDVPLSDPAYRLHRVWLDDREEQGYYAGFANEGLWPLCHRVHVQPTFRSDDLNAYWTVNERFSDAVCEEAEGPCPFVLVQDYHLALAPSMIRERLPHSTIVTFWHIPWPAWQTFEIFPWRHQILAGLLGSDIVGFQTAQDCRNFFDTVEHCLEAHIDRDHETILHAGHRSAVRSYPASIEWPSVRAVKAPSVEECRQQLLNRFELRRDMKIVVGVDRLDYTKGLVEKFLAVERLLECFPEMNGRVVFVQIAEPSRDRLPAYRDLRARLVDIVGRINSRFGRAGYCPAVLLETHHEPDDVYAFLRAADVCYVGSLHDGMNLVAKEFVAARDDERGVLVLSAFTGAARQLPEALPVNPYDIDDSATILHRALTMPAIEQHDRMRQLRSRLAEFSAHRWAGEMLSDAAAVARDTRAGWQSAVLEA